MEAHQMTDDLRQFVSKAPAIANPPTFASLAEERQHRKERLAAGFRLFSKFGFDEGVAGHITVRDPEFPETFWLNAFGMSFSLIKASDLVRVDHDGRVVEGDHAINPAAFAIHSRVHAARPDAIGVAHSHSLHGRAFSALGRTLDMITQDVCAFYDDLALHDDYGGVAELDEGQAIAKALGSKKAAILQNHGMITVGESVDAAIWWFITLERSCQVQLLAEAAAARTGQPLKTVSETAARQAYAILGKPLSGWFQFQPLYARIVKEQPDLLN